MASITILLDEDNRVTHIHVPHEMAGVAAHVVKGRDNTRRECVLFGGNTMHGCSYDVSKLCYKTTIAYATQTTPRQPDDAVTPSGPPYDPT